MINSTLIQTAIAMAQEIFSQQTAEELQNMKAHFGKAYDEGKILAEIAVKLVLRVGGVDMQASRDLSPITALVFDAEHAYRERYGVGVSL